MQSQWNDAEAAAYRGAAGRSGSTPRACSGATTRWCCTAAATPRSRSASPTSSATRRTSCTSRAAAGTWRRSRRRASRRCGSSASLRLATLERLSDPQMVQELRAAMTDPSAPTPSVETILHAILPYHVRRPHPRRRAAGDHQHRRRRAARPRDLRRLGGRDPVRHARASTWRAWPPSGSRRESGPNTSAWCCSTTASSRSARRRARRTSG